MHARALPAVLRLGSAASAASAGASVSAGSARAATAPVMGAAAVVAGRRWVAVGDRRTKSTSHSQDHDYPGPHHPTHRFGPLAEPRNTAVPQPTRRGARPQPPQPAPSPPRDLCPEALSATQPAFGVRGGRASFSTAATGGAQGEMPDLSSAFPSPDNNIPLNPTEREEELERDPASRSAAGSGSGSGSRGGGGVTGAGFESETTSAAYDGAADPRGTGEAYARVAAAAAADGTGSPAGGGFGGGDEGRVQEGEQRGGGADRFHTLNLDEDPSSAQVMRGSSMSPGARITPGPRRNTGGGGSQSEAEGVPPLAS
ncbi:hypothetical protein HYH03_005095 [Edaphochlamys debaryana]|uniref:Uncharacterized protein n=1 Tax=Edaphochlamys debaryana TaxID=47281 RepID=A0A836C2C5_9CHLO|nr:hypothetical protein HYH03_005095 [Edaphochlamys debaryana]|eukprot:KAG2496677.1 hypothetical protein HYH03_005095 [Edaphochlamys debaryana]